MTDLTPAVVASSTRTPVLQGVMGVLRSLGPLGVPVHLVHPCERTAMARSRWARSSHQLALDPDDPGAYVEALLELGARIGGRPVLIGTDDLVAQVVSDHAEALSTAFRLRVPSGELSRQLSDKCELAVLCKDHGVPSPDASVVRTLTEAHEFARAVGYPVVVKARTPEGLRGLGASVRIAGSEAELTRIISHGGQVRDETLLQEHIPGGADSVWMFNGYFDADGRCRHAFTGQKLRQCRPDTGYTSYGVCARNDDVEQMVVEFLTKLGYRGIVDLGVRYDARTGEYLMLDVNPRLGATFRLFVGADGTDVVRALYGDLTGRPCAPSSTLPGRTWASEPHDALASLIYAKQRRLGLKELVSSYRHLDETAWWSAKDPAPFFAAFSWTVGRGWGRGKAAQARPDLVQHFDKTVPYWDDVYSRPDVEGQTYRRRLALTLEWVDQLGLAKGDRVLDLGVGAGHLSSALAERGVRVVAVDNSPLMLQRAQRRGREQSSIGTVLPVQADGGRLPFTDGAFTAAIALGVLPWVDAPAGLVAELRRVCADGGHVIVSSDSRRRLHWALDPLYNVALRRARRAMRPLLRLKGTTPSPTLHEAHEVEGILMAAGVRPLRRAPVGFGPFTFLGRPVLSARVGMRASTALERMASTTRPGLEPMSSQHLVLARKEGAA